MPVYNETLRLYLYDAVENPDPFALAEADGSSNVLGNGLTNRIIGNNFDNILDGAAGADTLAGGSGNDTYAVDDAGDVITENASEGNDNVRTSINYTLVANVENLFLATSAGAINGTGNVLDNRITGNDSANILSGEEGNDSLFGGDGIDQLLGGIGNDLLDGGAGIDEMAGGSGDDTYLVDDATETLAENVNEGTDTVNASVSFTLQDNFENLVLTGTANLTGTGNALANKLTGNNVNNTLTGGEGNDTLDGSAGADRLDGGTGNDTMAGGSGSDRYLVDNILDVVTESAGGGVDTVTTSVRYALNPTAEVEFLTAVSGRSAINLTGSQFDNTLAGNAGRNVLSGLGGDDELRGGAGRDDLRGGAGSDIFVFNTRVARTESDRVLDFNVRADSIYLDNAIFRKLGSGSEAHPRKLNAKFFTVGDEAKDRNDYLIYDPTRDDLLFDADGSGARAAVKIADFNNVRLTAADIFII